MKDRLTFLQFVVTSVNEIRTLVGVWEEMMDAVIDESPRKRADDALLRAFRMVGIALAQSEEGEEIILIFGAFWSMIVRFYQALWQLGFQMIQELDSEDSVTRCRLIPPDPQS